jgi:hypothetical protein
MAMKANHQRRRKMLKEVLLAATVTMSPLTEAKPEPLFCDVAKPIYVKVPDVVYLRSHKSGNILLEWIREHNQKIIDICGEIPRSIPG